MWRPLLYNEFNSPHQRDAEEFLEEYSKEIGSMSGRCMDIGIGPGDITVDFLLPRLNPNSTVTCADISETMLNYTRERYGHNDRLSFIKLDIETPNLPKDLVGQFDHVTSFYCINMCHDLRPAFKNIYSLLRPGGTVFLTFIASSLVEDAFSVLQANPKYQAYMKEVDRIIAQFQHVERPRQIAANLMTEAGFEVQSCSCRTLNNIYNSVDHLKDFLISLSPRETDQMPPELYAEYEKDLMQEALKREIVFTEDNGDGKNESKIFHTYRVIVAYLKKPL